MSRETRVWTDLCNMDSEDMRAAMVGKLLLVPTFVTAAQMAGVYGPVNDWLLAYRRGMKRPFPYTATTARAAAPATETHTRDRIHPGATHIQLPVMMVQDRPSPPAAATAPTAGSGGGAIVVTAAAKSLDFFQQSLELLGIDESETLTRERVKSAYKRASLRAHPDKGGSEAEFDALTRAYVYIGKVLDRVMPPASSSGGSGDDRLTAPVSLEGVLKGREKDSMKWGSSSGSGGSGGDGEPIRLSAKKLDMALFNKLFEENRLPDPVRDTGYGDWFKSSAATDDGGIAANAGKPGDFESVVRQYAQRNPGAIVKRHGPEAVVSGAKSGGTLLGEDGSNFSAGFGADVQFTDIKEAYTTGAVAFLEVANEQVKERSARSVEEAMRIREREMARVDPSESARIAAAAAALEERERRRQLRVASADTTAESWHKSMRNRLLITED